MNFRNAIDFQLPPREHVLGQANVVTRFDPFHTFSQGKSLQKACF